MRVIKYPYSSHVDLEKEPMEVTTYCYLNNRQQAKATIGDLKLWIQLVESLGACDEDELEECDLAIGFSTFREDLESLFSSQSSTSNKTIYSKFSTFKADYQ